MSIKTKIQINLNFFLIVASYMILEWYSPYLAEFFDMNINV